MTDPRSALWKTIATTLGGEIAQGRYRIGDKLPTEAELSLRFGVNRHTIRRALKDLADTGTVHARRGSGVFVACEPLDYAIGRRVRFSQNLAASGRVGSSERTRCETVMADARDAQALGLRWGRLSISLRGFPCQMATRLPPPRGVPCRAPARFPRGD